MALTFFVYFAGCRYNYYISDIHNEDKSIRKHYFDFSGIIFYKQSEISQISIIVHENLRKKNLSVQCNDNSTTICNYTISPKSTFLIFMLICGDVHPHPGPSNVKRQPKNPCKICNKGIIKTIIKKCLECNVCGTKVHIRCTKVPSNVKDNFNQSSILYTCDLCSFDSLPFNRCESFSPFFESDDEINPPDFINLPSTLKEDCFHAFKNKGLHFIHLNARSLLPKISELKIVAQRTTAAVISISETWLDETITNQEIQIDNYSVVRSDRSRNGGGVCMFIRNDIAFSILEDLKIEDMESIFVEILLPKTKPIVIGTCYRPPKQTCFLDLLQQTLNKIRPDLEQIILGDFNIDLKISTTATSKSYKNMLNVSNLKQLIQEPTRVTPSSCTIIDHILCNNEEKISQSGVIPTGISDHFMTFCTRKAHIKDKCDAPNIVTVRSMKHYNKDLLNEKLTSADWSSLFLCRNIENAWQIFRSTFHSILDDIAPHRDIKIRQHTDPWMTSEILENIRNRDELLKCYNKSKNKDDYKQF